MIQLVRIQGKKKLLYMPEEAGGQAEIVATPDADWSEPSTWFSRTTGRWALNRERRGEFGWFRGDCIVQFLQHPGADRIVRVVEPFLFMEPNGREWPVEADTLSNGASIPRFLWTLVGSPFTGDYRRAALVHDPHTGMKAKPHEDVHRMLWLAARADDCSQTKSWTVYRGVTLFGPKWKVAA